MATYSISKRKTKKSLILVLVLIFVLIVASIVTWKGALERPFIPTPEPKERVKIDFEALKIILETPIFEKFVSFEEIIYFEDEIGRENPFRPFEIEDEVLPDDEVLPNNDEVLPDDEVLPNDDEVLPDDDEVLPDGDIAPLE